MIRRGVFLAFFVLIQLQSLVDCHGLFFLCASVKAVIGQGSGDITVTGKSLNRSVADIWVINQCRKAGFTQFVRTFDYRIHSDAQLAKLIVGRIVA